jgi:hypothetical protein
VRINRILAPGSMQSHISQTLKIVVLSLFNYKTHFYMFVFPNFMCCLINILFDLWPA